MAGRQPSALIRFVRRIAVAETPETGDALLLRRFIDGRDAEAFAALVQRHGPMVFGVCRRMLGDIHEAEDCFQATFLILARRASAVGRPDLVGGWLHGVACRVATRARHLLVRRRAQERQVVDVPAGERTPELIWTDLRPVLDEEIERLPELYRVPFVLCYLDGRTNDEAAQLLGCPKGTIVSRLATARERLRRRLTRRGITLPAAVLGALVAEHATAAVPAALVQATAGGVTGAIAPSVAILVEGVLMTMRVHRIATVLAVLLATTFFVGGAGALLRSPLLAQTGPEIQPAVAQGDFTNEGDEPPAAKGDGPAKAVQPGMVAEAYENNDARADELFTNKRVRVIGAMSRIKRVNLNAEGLGMGGPDWVYRLTLGEPPTHGPGASRMGIPGVTGRPGMPGGSKMPGTTMPGEFNLTFDFPLEAAKKLAPLRPGQLITVEGLCEGPEAGPDGTIHFRDAKLIQVHAETDTKKPNRMP